MLFSHPDLVYEESGARALVSRYTCVRFLRAATEVLLPTATEAPLNVQDSIVEMAKGQKKTRETGTTCYEALQPNSQGLGRKRDIPVEHEGRA